MNLASRINKLYEEGKITWQAEAYDFWDGMDADELNSRAG